MPHLRRRCPCHVGELGGWDGTSLDTLEVLGGGARFLPHFCDVLDKSSHIAIHMVSVRLARRIFGENTGGGHHLRWWPEYLRFH